MRVVMAANPAARFGRSEAVGHRLEQVLDEHGFTVERAERFSAETTLDALRAAVATKPDALLMAGGDGTVHLGLNAVAGTDVPLAVIPAGSGNDFARSIGVGKDVARAIEELPDRLRGPTQPCDLMRMEHANGVTYAAGILSIGFDADVAARSTRLTRIPTSMRYYAAITATLVSVKHRRFHLTVDGEPLDLETVIAGVSNNSIFGGGIELAPHASMQDGELTLVWADKVSYPGFLRLLQRALAGTHMSDPKIHTTNAKEVLVEGDQTVIAHADGEAIGRLPIRCTIAPNAIQVFGEPI